MIQNHKKLEAFAIADELTLGAYRVTALMPMSERFGLQTQLRSAVARIPVQIIAACARQSTPEYMQLLTVAHDASVEFRYLLGLAARLELVSDEDIKLLDHLAHTLTRSLRRLLDTSMDKPARPRRAQSMKLKTPSLKLKATNPKQTP